VEKAASFGATVRDRRLALGYSLGQLATKVHKTAASIRAWERGTNYPDGDELTALAEALDLDSGVLTELLATQAAQDEVEVAQEPVADPWSETPTRFVEEEVRAVEQEVRPGDGAVSDAQKEKLLSAAKLDEGFIDESPEAPEMPQPMVSPGGAAPIHEAMTEAVPVVSAGSIAVAASQAPPESDADGPRRFAFGEGANPILETWDLAVEWYRHIFDPNRKWIYRVRVVLLIIALYIMLRVLGWAMSHLWDALQEVFDSISFSPTETPDVAN
jgi:transcriptional regulator with XRE-family HTH domain